MATVRVLTKSPTTRPRHPHVIINSEDGKKLTIPLAGPIRHSGLAAKYETHDRVGQYDTIHKIGNPLHVMDVTLTWVARNSAGVIDPDRSIEPDLQILRFFAREGLRLWFTNWGGSTGGWFRITDFSIDVLTMKEGTNDATSATVTLQLTKPTDQLALGPVSGGNATMSKSPVTKPKTITTKPGQSLHAAAFKATGDGNNWLAIAKANSIKKPTKVKAGTTLRVPR